MTTYGTWRRERGCERKRPYHCQLDANQAVLAFMRDGKRMTTYTCEWCGLIHLTSGSQDEIEQTDGG